MKLSITTSTRPRSKEGAFPAMPCATPLALFPSAGGLKSRILKTLWAMSILNRPNSTPKPWPASKTIPRTSSMSRLNNTEFQLRLPVTFHHIGIPTSAASFSSSQSRAATLRFLRFLHRRLTLPITPITLPSRSETTYRSSTKSYPTYRRYCERLIEKSGEDEADY